MPTYKVTIQEEYQIEVEAKDKAHAEKLMDAVVYDEILDQTKHEYVFEKVSDEPSVKEIEIEEGSE
jgi:hypothetical protein